VLLLRLCPSAFVRLVLFEICAYLPSTCPVRLVLFEICAYTAMCPTPVPTKKNKNKKKKLVSKTVIIL